MNKRHHPPSRGERIKLAQDHPKHRKPKDRSGKVKHTVEQIREEETEHELQEFLTAKQDGG